MVILYIIIAILVIIVLWYIGAYNGLVRSRNRVKEAWSDINVQLRRRHDLIPNLVETVKGYAAHEKEVFEQVTAARTQAVTAGTIDQKGHAEHALTQALGKLFAVAEAYPTLKANENFAKLQDELTDTEDKIQAARRFYNTNVMDFNTKLQVFPTNLIANSLGFTKEEFFQLDSAEEAKLPEVKF
ncbi:MAG TPA: LemA family protein [Candidatus Paceibacterota bacterium]|nr:LemA family protein [Candidatus Paceibacterota bacterium]